MRSVLIGLSVLALSACSSPKDANESNFKAAIQEYYSSKPACFSTGVNFPHSIVKLSNEFKRSSPYLNELVSLGFLKSTEGEEEDKSFFRNRDKPKIFKVIIYSLTEKGKEIEVAPENRSNFMKNFEFCYGDYEVVDIKNFSEPAEAMGHTISDVNFTYKLTGLQSWAKDSDVLKEKFSSIQANIDSIKTPRDNDTVLVLTNKGWVHERLFKN